MRTVRIEGANPKPLGAPPNWDPERDGHCGGLFIRQEIIGGVHFMRSAWEMDQSEALHQLAGGKMILGIGGYNHPVVHLQADPPPPDAPAVYASRRTFGPDGSHRARVDAIYPYGGGRRCYSEVIIDERGFAMCCAVAIGHCDDLADRHGWLTAPTPEDT